MRNFAAPIVSCGLAALLLISACSANGETSAQVVEEDLTIDTASLKEGVTFVPYSENGRNVQLLLAKVGNDVSVKLDTCNSCNGSPKAYYAYDGNDTITCQNCGFEFAIDELDQRQGGCSPMDIAYTEDGEQISIALRDLESKAALFEGIQR